MSRRNFHGGFGGYNNHGGRKNSKSIPPRWLHCPRKGQLIANKFIPFKTPLSSQYDNQVPEECRFPPGMLIRSLESYKVKIGLWIDLTNTRRFYDSTDIENEGIAYVKLQCKGRSECPNEEQRRSFIGICQNFISKHPLEVIVVHCTHGFNRTGFLICSYLVEAHSWSIEAAVKTFALCREPGMYKQEYLEEIFRLYGDVEDAMSAPPLPSWCHDDDGLEVDDDGQSLEAEPEQGYRQRRFKKKTPTFMVNNDKIIPVETEPKLTQIQRKVQHMCSFKKQGFPGLQPVSMDLTNIINIVNDPYMVSWKADGTRYMMLIDGENEIYFIDRENDVFQVHGLTFPQRKNPHKHIANTLVDGEMVIDKVNGSDVLRYLIYDIVRFEDQEVGGTDFNRRLLCISKELGGPRREAIEKGRIDRSSEPFGVRSKEFWPAKNARMLLSKSFTSKLAHEIDGLIFQPAQDPYQCGVCKRVLKWKPANMNSIDFKLKIIKENRPGMLPESKGYLFVGNLDTPFAEMKVTKELRKYDNKIIECKWEQNRWQLMRERTDKSHPNGHRTALAVLESIQKPVTEEILFSAIDQNAQNDQKNRHPYSSGYAPSSSSSHRRHDF